MKCHQIKWEKVRGKADTRPEDRGIFHTCSPCARPENPAWRLWGDVTAAPLWGERPHLTVRLYNFLNNKIKIICEQNEGVVICVSVTIELL